MPQVELQVLPGSGTGGGPAVPVDQLPVTALPLTAIAGAFSARADGPDPAHVRTLAELDVELPPILVHRPTMRVVDGLHRVEATRMRGGTHVPARLLEGDETDAFVLAVRSNIAHGLPLSVRDRKRAAVRITESHPLWSDRRIAAATGLAARTVAEIRRRRGGTAQARVGQDGRLRPVNGAAGRERAAELIAADPSLSLRQVARAAGISPETVRSVRARMFDEQGAAAEPTSLDDRRSQRDAAMAAHPSASRAAAPVTGPLAPVQPQGRRLSRVSTLRKDPSLRFNDPGRMLLRLLDLHAVSDPEWSSIIDAVPEHTVEAVAEAARACAVMWTDLSRRLEPGVRTIA